MIEWLDSQLEHATIDQSSLKSELGLLIAFLEECEALLEGSPRPQY